MLFKYFRYVITFCTPTMLQKINSVNRLYHIFQLNCQRNISHYVQGQSPERGIREYFYYIDHQGMLYLDDARMKNFTSCFKEKQFLKFFFSRLKFNDTGRYYPDFPYLSPCGRERNFIRCDDLPLVFTNVLDGETSEPKLAFNHADRFLVVPFQPNKICMTQSGRVYHPAPEKSGRVGLISDKLSIEWTAGKRFEFENGEENPPTHFNWNSEKIVLDNQLIKILETLNPFQNDTST